MRVSVALALSAVLCALALILSLSRREPRLAGTNNVPAVKPIATLPPRATVCQRGELFPEAASSVRIVAVYGPRGARLQARFEPPRGAELIGRAATVERTGPVRLTLPDRRSDLVGTLCVRNAGARVVALAGNDAGWSVPARIDGRAASGQIRVEYLRAGRESWWSLAPTIATRIAAGRGGPLREATLWVGLALVAAAWAVACVALLRAAAR